VQQVDALLIFRAAFRTGVGGTPGWQEQQPQAAAVVIDAGQVGVGGRMTGPVAADLDVNVLGDVAR
jgi:hypothetical protein